MAVTIKQIAERAGLSVPTVSRILNNDSELFRAATRDKVLKAAKDLGYRPNSYRMALRTKRFNSIGLLYPTTAANSLLSYHTFYTLREELQRRNQHLVAGQASHHIVKSEEADVENGDGESHLPKMLREWSVDGLLIDSIHAAPVRVQELISRTKIPAIWLNAKRPSDCVYADEFTGAKRGTEILIGKGHSRISFIENGKHDPTGERHAGYAAAMKAAGLTPNFFGPSSIPTSERAVFFQQWIEKFRGSAFPTAYFCDHSDLAASFYLAAMWSKLSVPKDLSILTFHDHLCDTLGFPMSAMRLPAAELALQGLTALDEKIKKPEVEIAPRALPITFEQGTTIGPPPK